MCAVFRLCMVYGFVMLSKLHAFDKHHASIYLSITGTKTEKPNRTQQTSFRFRFCLSRNEPPCSSRIMLCLYDCARKHRSCCQAAGTLQVWLQYIHFFDEFASGCGWLVFCFAQNQSSSPSIIFLQRHQGRFNGSSWRLVLVCISKLEVWCHGHCEIQIIFSGFSPRFCQ